MELLIRELEAHLKLLIKELKAYLELIIKELEANLEVETPMEQVVICSHISETTPTSGNTPNKVKCPLRFWYKTRFELGFILTFKNQGHVLISF